MKSTTRFPAHLDVFSSPKFASARSLILRNEKRRCALCDRVFTGAEISISLGARGVQQLRCPTPKCRSTPELWMHPDHPLLSEEAYKDWKRILKRSSKRLIAES